MTKTKLDLTKEYKTYYTAKTTPEVVEFNEAQFLTIEGKGAPGSKEFTAERGVISHRLWCEESLQKARQ